MIHLPDLIQDLGFILVIAAAVTLLFKKLKQPIVLGYLIAGLLVGPHFTMFHTVKDVASVKIWAEIGVIILLFALGLEFSFKKLATVGRTVTITALFETSFMLTLGFFSGQLLGWSRTDSLFLGGIIAISSTSIIVRAFDELGLKGRRFVSLVFGVLIVEDVVAVILLVLFSTLAISKLFSGAELIFLIARFGFFIVLWFLIGIYLLPPFLSKIRNLLNDETTLIVSLGLCLFMVLIATELGFSPALGAFVMGSLLAETKEGNHIGQLIHPIRDLFAAIFFVSVGMLIDPKILIDYGPQVLLISLVIIVGKFIGASLGALISGTTLRHAVQTGLSLTQIGEFSFIIATLGLTLKLTSDFLYPIAVAVSALTTFTTPYLIRSADRFHIYLENKLPKMLLNRLERYQNAIQSETMGKGIGFLLWRAFGKKMLLNSILVIAIFLFSRNIILPIAYNFFQNIYFSTIVITFFASFFSTPFFWAITFGLATSKLNESENLRVLKLALGFSILRGSYAMLLAALMINSILPFDSAEAIVIFIGLVSLVAVGRFSKKIYSKIEQRFMTNLSTNYTLEKPKPPQLPPLAPWDVGLTDFIVNPNSSIVGLSLQQSKLKETYGITIALVERGEDRILAPDRNWVIMPFDKLFVIGSDEQLIKVKECIEQTCAPNKTYQSSDTFGLRSLKLTENCKFTGKPLRDSGLREAISGLVVGIERNEKRILSPDSSIVLQPDDLLWVVGDLEKIKQIPL